MKLILIAIILTGLCACKGTPNLSGNVYKGTIWELGVSLPITIKFKTKTIVEIEQGASGIITGDVTYAESPYKLTLAWKHNNRDYNVPATMGYNYEKLDAYYSNFYNGVVNSDSLFAIKQ